MKDEIVASAVKSVPPVGASLWMWIGSHDLNWWASFAVSVATFGYIGLQSFVLWRDKIRRRREHGNG